ncbi:hypothetical protein ACHAXH_000486 [Discostella pseudostelligera]
MGRKKNYDPKLLAFLVRTLEPINEEEWENLSGLYEHLSGHQHKSKDVQVKWGKVEASAEYQSTGKEYYNKILQTEKTVKLEKTIEGLEKTIESLQQQLIIATATAGAVNAPGTDAEEDESGGGGGLSEATAKMENLGLDKAPSPSSTAAGNNINVESGVSQDPCQQEERVPLWAQMVSAVKPLFAVKNTRHIIEPSERQEAASALTMAICADAHTSDYVQHFGSYCGYSVNKMLSGRLTNSELKIEDFDLGMVLGEGGFGKVYLARHKVSGFIVGLKSLKRPEPTDQDASIMLKREVHFHHDICHPNVLKMHNLFFDKDRVYIILEYATGGCLRDIILPLSKRCAAKYILDLSEAIALCHANEIIHRDIKPDNFLLGCDGRIKISDFGVSAQDSPVLPRRTCVGTKGYTAPEILLDDKHDKRVDIWSLGVCLHEFLVGKLPTCQISVTEATIIWPKNLGNLDDDAKDLISKMTKRNPEERIHLEDIPKHRFCVLNIE